MKIMLFAGLILVVLGIASLLVPIPRTEKHGIKAGDVNIGAKSPSFWLKNIHITLQFAQLGGMWVPVTFDAVATVRLLGQYTLAGLTVRSSESLSAAP
jgi:hypothetical protein